MRGFPFALPIQVRFRDVDGMGHVNNAVYFTFIEAARTEYMYRINDTQTLQQVDWIVATASLNFRRAATYGDPLEVGVRPMHVGQTSFTLYYEVWDRAKGQLVADGQTVIVMFDYEARKPKPIHATLRARLERDLGPGQPAATVKRTASAKGRRRRSKTT